MANVVDYIINSVFRRKGVDDAKRAIDELNAKAKSAGGNIGKPFDAANAGALKMAGAMALADAAVRISMSVWKRFKDKVKEAWDAAADAAKQNTEKVVASFDRIANAYKALRGELSIGASRGKMESAAEKQYENAAHKASLQDNELQRQRALSGVTDPKQIDAINREYNRRRKELEQTNREAEIDQRIKDNAREKKEVEARIALIDKEQKSIEKAIETARKMREGVGEADGGNSSKAIAKMLGLTPDDYDKLGKTAEERITAAIKKAKQRIEDLGREKRGLEIEVEAKEKSNTSLGFEKEAVRLQRESTKLAQENEDAVLKAREAEAEAAAAQKKSEEEAREARRKAIADKREEIRLQHDEVTKRKEAARKTAEDYRDQIAAAKEALAVAQQAAQAQMPTNEDIRAERRRRKHGGYRGGDVGEDGVAGTWDDEKAVKRAERIAEKIRRKRSGQWNGRLSKEDEEFYKQWFDARKGALNAKDLAKQKEALMLAAQNAEIQAAADIAKMQGDVAGLRQDLAALLAAK